MSLSFEKLKHIGAPLKNLINGYIRIYQNEFFGDIASDNPYYNIPPLINNYCMLFYEIFTWYKKKFGKGLEFTSDTEVVLNETKRAGNWPTCLFENTISNEFCNKFSIAFKIKPFGTNRFLPDFYIGYTFGETLEESVKSWDAQLGENENSSTSESWCFNHGIFHSGDGDKFKPLKKSYDFRLTDRDLLTLVFDFKQSRVTVYQNEKVLDCRDLKVNKLWIGLSFYHHRDGVEMIEYKYD